ncbi:glycosyltransferase [Macrococcus hajekii]|uniref:Glycosyltransferase n=1 Tax=Macrococcus hajekii TaxID=198482 RepID=A0A4R6BJV5_9STAP|nr:glycosyltransferase family 2 protein [Macrococcus hajekii]TDM01927.1 glycosyltransferase [Macrococcus hajekii]GGB08627.1 4,4'-diaponeurosporenoate glycosyltransferase [Macrococcus hajekii]
MLIAIIAFIILSIVAGHIVFYRQPYMKQNSTSAATLTIIIPARNEAHNLPHLLHSLSKQTIEFDCIVVDDGSTDQTADIARQYGATVLSPPQETDWQGKSAACYLGAMQADSDLLLFLDADTWFEKSDALNILLSNYNGGLVSVQPYHQTRKPYEQLSVWFNLLTIIGLNIFTPVRSKHVSAFGPVVLCSKAHYQKTNGHSAIRHQLIEGFGLADIFYQAGLPVDAYLGKGIVNFRMYPDGIQSMGRGWAKHFATGAAATELWIMIGILYWMVGSMASLIFVIWGVAQNNLIFISALIVYSLYAWHFYTMSRRTGSFTMWTALCSSITFVYFLVIFTWSWFNTYILKKSKWKDRDINL